MTWPKVASGRDSVISTVLSSTTRTPESPSPSPAFQASNPSIMEKKPAPGLCVSGSVTRSRLYLTSSAVISRPLWKAMPSFSAKVWTSPSSEISTLSASSGRSVVVPGS